MAFGNFVRIENAASFDVGVAKLLAAGEAAGVVASRAAGETLKSAWQEQIDTVLIHGYATGKYHDSINVGDPVVTGRFVEVEVSSDATNEQDMSYPFFLEFGTSKMPAYPTLTPAIEQSGTKVVAMMAVAEGSVLSRLFPGSTPSLSNFGFQTAVLEQALAQMESLYGGKSWTYSNFKQK